MLPSRLSLQHAWMYLEKYGLHTWIGIH
jgi:hypothetical protein